MIFTTSNPARPSQLLYCLWQSSTLLPRSIPLPVVHRFVFELRFRFADTMLHGSRAVEARRENSRNFDRKNSDTLELARDVFAGTPRIALEIVRRLILPIRKIRGIFGDFSAEGTSSRLLVRILFESLAIDGNAVLSIG